MTKDEFILKHGKIQIKQDADSYFERIKLPYFENGQWNRGISSKGDKILNGHFYTHGYFGYLEDPFSSKPDWMPVSRAIEFTDELVKILWENDCYALDSEGDGKYFPFIYTGELNNGIPDFKSLGVLLSPELKKACDKGELLSPYNTTIDVYNIANRDCIFWDNDLDEDYEDDLEHEEYKAYKTVSDKMKALFDKMFEIVFYPAFIEFPVITGGVNEDDFFIGVITSCVWT